jgi:hypothetical protein
MKIKSISTIILMAIAPTVLLAINPLSSQYITNERISERYKTNYEYFTTHPKLLYYWQAPSFLYFNTIWGFCLTGDTCSDSYQLIGKVKDGVDLSSGSTERIIDETVTRSLSKDTAKLLVTAWSKAFKKMTHENRHGVDGTRYYAGINLFYDSLGEEMLKADGTYWSPDEFSIDHDLTSIASSIHDFLFREAESENAIIESCEVIIRTSHEAREALRSRFKNINEPFSRPIDPFNAPEPLSREEKDRYISEYKAIWLMHYQKEEEEFDRIARFILPKRVRMSEPGGSGQSH